ncbi:hypothetical protein F5Y19DRAFT_143939 [Xylariaceae sp. FL1651]|nr:hypothetical protein F5Y19DRAFT_143939 [Xylariaceae sp. FL1651]
MESVVASFQNSSYGKLACVAIVVGFAAVNLKALPFAYTFQILPSLYRLFKPRFAKRRPRRDLGASTEQHTAAPPALFKHHVTRSRAIFSDLDINIHKSNSTFFVDADISRARLLTTLLSEGLATLGPANFILASVTCKFRQEIPPYKAYVVSSRILAWNEQAMYLVTYFLKPGMKLPLELDVLGGPDAVLKDDKYRKAVFATMVTKYVFKAGRKTVSPHDVLRSAGLLIGPEQKGASTRSEGFYDIREIEQAVKHGLEYVQGCME